MRIAVALSLWFCLTSLSAAQPVQEILAASDAIRNPSEPFVLTLSLVEYRNKKQQDTAKIHVYAKMNPSRGQYDNLVRFIEPARDRNKLLLKNGNELWFFDPGTKAGVRLSPQQRLLGQAANGDVVTVNLASDYEAELEREETIADGEGNQRLCNKLKLSATRADVTYFKIDYWVEKDSNRPIKGQFYSESGRLLKTAFYRKYQTQLGTMRPMETVIIDGMDPKWVTSMQYGDYRLKEIPESWLRKDGLSSFHD